MTHAEDYTQQQPRVDSLQDALDEGLGAGRAGLGRLFVPRDEAEVAALVAAADAFGGKIAVGRAEAGLIGVDMAALATVGEIDVQSQLATVGFGVTPDALAARLEQHGLVLPCLWFADPSLPIGAALCAGEGAPLVFALTAVLPDGTIFRTPASPRRASGPAPEAVVLGQRHRFALLSSATLRLKAREVTSDLGASGTGPAMVALARDLAAKDVPWISAALHRDGATVRLSIRIAERDRELAGELGPADAPSFRSGGTEPIAPQWRPWSAIRAGLEDQTISVVAPLDRHGGWVRGLPSSPVEPELDEIRQCLDPHGTLEQA